MLWPGAMPFGCLIHIGLLFLYFGGTGVAVEVAVSTPLDTPTPTTATSWPVSSSLTSPATSPDADDEGFSWLQFHFLNPITDASYVQYVFQPARAIATSTVLFFWILSPCLWVFFTRRDSTPVAKGALRRLHVLHQLVFGRLSFVKDEVELGEPPVTNSSPSARTPLLVGPALNVNWVLCPSDLMALLAGWPAAKGHSDSRGTLPVIEYLEVDA